MDPATIAILGGLFLAYALVSGKLEGTLLTAPLLFVAFGLVAGVGGLGVANIDVEHGAIHIIAELTLILVLFTDAARIDLGRVRADHNLPVRMLVIGLPLAIAAGTFGAALLPEGLEHIDVMFVVYGVLSLTLIRMIPIALSLIASGIRLPTFLFLGWFGPRGLASILFVLLILEEAELPHQSELLAITVITVALSVVLHGVSAAPLARAYGRIAGRMGECEESKTVSDVPLRSGPTISNSSEP